MTFRHAAAFALLGWYLILPPAAEAPRFDLTAPLNKWTVDSKFASDGECKQVLAAHRLEEARKHIEPRVWTFGRCVASSDPRLAPEQKVK